jgi:hypothetical protein
VNCDVLVYWIFGGGSPILRSYCVTHLFSILVLCSMLTLVYMVCASSLF